jgi:MSHA biogenesis protein MshP
MKRTSTTFRSRRGFAMVAVIALLAILAVFGASIVVISTSQQIGAALDLQGVRAYHAARGGVEWAMYQVLRNGRSCADLQGKTLAYGANLAGFSVTVGCRSSSHEEGSTPVTVFTISATGCNEAVCPTGGTPGTTYVERQLRLTLGSN